MSESEVTAEEIHSIVATALSDEQEETPEGKEEAQVEEIELSDMSKQLRYFSILHAEQLRTLGGSCVPIALLYFVNAVALLPLSLSLPAQAPAWWPEPEPETKPQSGRPGPSPSPSLADQA